MEAILPSDTVPHVHCVLGGTYIGVSVRLSLAKAARHEPFCPS